MLLSTRVAGNRPYVHHVQTTPQALGRQRALALWPSPRPAACCGRGPIRGRLWDDLQEFRGKSPGLPPPKGLSRQAPWGFTTYYQNQTPPLLQKRLVGGNASPAETFLQFKTCFNAQRESPAIVAHGDQLIQAPFVRVRKRRLTSESGGIQMWGASLCPDDEVTRQGSDCC